MESQLRAIMAQGYKRTDEEKGKENVQGEVPYIAYDINGKRIFRNLLRFGAWNDMSSPLHALNKACSEANEHELPAKK